AHEHRLQEGPPPSPGSLQQQLPALRPQSEHGPLDSLRNDSRCSNANRPSRRGVSLSADSAGHSPARTSERSTLNVARFRYRSPVAQAGSACRTDRPGSLDAYPDVCWPAFFSSAPVCRGAPTMIPQMLFCLVMAAAGAEAANSTAAGKFIVEHPTLLNLGSEWGIRGDANRNATVGVQFRPAGELAWREALPLVRIGGENVYRRRENLDYTVPEGFAGSILNLQPGTEYECRFQLTDPDGASGQTGHTVRVRTRSEPQPSQEGRTLHVYPPDHRGPRQEPSFTSLLQAYYGAGLGDWSVVWERRAQPGDTILMHAGLYKSDRLNYVDPLMTPFDGTMSLTLKGTRERPITIKAAGDGEVIFDGAGNHRLF